VQAVQSDALDELADLRLRALELQAGAARAQAPREHGEVEDERRVRERKIGEIDDDVAPADEGARERTAATPLRRPYLVPAAA
jgi:hypothetical protein